MEFHEQKILPAVRQIKDLEKLLHSSYEYIVILDIHVGQLKSVISLAKQYCKKVFYMWIRSMDYKVMGMRRSIYVRSLDRTGYFQQRRA